MGFIGMDTLAIGHLSRQLSIQAGEVAAAARELSSLLSNTVWAGADRAAFQSEWATIHPLKTGDNLSASYAAKC